MKIVLNKCYGGFSLSAKACEALGLKSRYTIIVRNDERLISLMEEYGSEWVSGDCAALVLVDIPDNCTDWEMDEYDGWERIIYVVDGMLYHA